MGRARIAVETALGFGLLFGVAVLAALGGMVEIARLGVRWLLASASPRKRRNDPPSGLGEDEDPLDPKEG
jgi:hypothetical protein